MKHAMKVTYDPEVDVLYHRSFKSELRHWQTDLFMS